MDAYWRETIAARRGQRTDDVVSEIFHAQVGGENLTDDEIYGFCSLILPASQHTTINMMSNTAITLAALARATGDVAAEPGAVGRRDGRADPLRVTGAGSRPNGDA